MTQARIAETEKYACYILFNGGVEEPNKGEDRTRGKIPEGSDLRHAAPEMSAPEVYRNL